MGMIAILLGSHACKPKEPANFNVVLIVVDTLRSDHLSFYGYPQETAPFLSHLAGRSTQFENVFSASSWTSPATASIFTSLYPFQHGVMMGLMAIIKTQKIDPKIKVNRIPGEIDTITEVLKRNGFKTYGISDNLNIGKKQGFDQGFDRLRTFNYQGAHHLNALLKKWKNDITTGGKYFLYLHYMDPHAPYHQHEPLDKALKGRKNISLAAYNSEIRYVDRHIKEMYELFGWDKNTLLIITSDHGEGLWDHGFMGHGYSLYREEIQVPLLIGLPDSHQKKTISTNVSTIDILPTVRDLVGLPPSRHDEGVSLVPLIGDEKLEERFIFSHLWNIVSETHKKIEYKATIYQRIHFILRSPSQRELYDLHNDKKERHNRFHISQKSARILESKFKSFMKSCRKYNPESIYYRLSDEKLEKLKSLGYLR
jgi:choline-sulfatase